MVTLPATLLTPCHFHAAYCGQKVAVVILLYPLSCYVVTLMLSDCFATVMLLCCCPAALLSLVQLICGQSRTDVFRAGVMVYLGHTSFSPDSLSGYLSANPWTGLSLSQVSHSLDKP